MIFRRLSTALAVLALGAASLAGCGGNSSKSASSPTPSPSPSVDPKVLLNDAQHNLNSAPAVHFTLDSQNVPTGVTTVTKGEGDLSRPNKFAGQLFVQGGLFNGNIQIRAIGDTVWAQLPVVGWQQINPAKYGVPNPANLIDPQTGVSAWIGDLQNPVLKGKQRTNGEVTYEIDGQVPGKDVGKLLPDADPSQPMDAQLFVTESGHKLTRVVLTGPFYDKQKTSTYTLDLSKYGENVSISKP